MKIRILPLLLLLNVNYLYASDYCALNVTIDDSYTPPAGWHVTFLQKKPEDKTAQVIFHLVEYNYDHKDGANNNRISCFYRNRPNNAMLEITTDKDKIPSPANTGSWQTLDATSLYCFPRIGINPKECPF